MTESDESQKNLAYIRTHVDNLERMVRFQIASSPNSKAAITEHLKARAGAAEFYLALADGPKTQDQLADLLELDRSNVSRIASHMLDGGLVMKVPGPNGSRQLAYTWSDLEQIIGVSKIARKIAAGSASATNRASRDGASKVQGGGSLEPVEPD